MRLRTAGTLTMLAAVPLLALMLLQAPAIHAQTAPQGVTGTLRGVVRGEMSMILREADVFLDNDSTRARTGPDGRFRFDGVGIGEHWIFVRAIGYTATRRLVTVGAEDQGELTVRLTPAPYVLPDVEVRADSEDHVRRLMGWTTNAWGSVVTEEQIRRYGTLGLSVIARTRLPWQATNWFDLARREVIEAQGADIFGRPYAEYEFNPWQRYGWSGTPGFGGQTTTAPLTGSDRPGRRDRMSLGTGCPPAISINGEKSWSETRLDEIRPDLVSSMEIYKPKRDGGHVPADFASFPNAVNCGLVVVWLR